MVFVLLCEYSANDYLHDTKKAQGNQYNASNTRVKHREHDLYQYFVAYSCCKTQNDCSHNSTAQHDHGSSTQVNLMAWSLSTAWQYYIYQRPGTCHHNRKPGDVVWVTSPRSTCAMSLSCLRSKKTTLARRTQVFCVPLVCIRDTVCRWNGELAYLAMSF